MVLNVQKMNEKNRLNGENQNFLILNPYENRCEPFSFRNNRRKKTKQELCDKGSAQVNYFFFFAMCAVRRVKGQNTTLIFTFSEGCVCVLINVQFMILLPNKLNCFISLVKKQNHSFGLVRTYS